MIRHDKLALKLDSIAHAYVPQGPQSATILSKLLPPFDFLKSFKDSTFNNFDKKS